MKPKSSLRHYIHYLFHELPEERTPLPTPAPCLLISTLIQVYLSLILGVQLRSVSIDNLLCKTHTRLSATTLMQRRLCTMEWYMSLTARTSYYTQLLCRIWRKESELPRFVHVCVILDEQIRNFARTEEPFVYG